MDAAREAQKTQASRTEAYGERSVLQNDKEMRRPGRSNLLLDLFVRSLHLTPLAKLIELNLALDELLVLARPIVDTLTLCAGEADELFLGHNGRTIPDKRLARKTDSRNYKVGGTSR